MALALPMMFVSEVEFEFNLHTLSTDDPSDNSRTSLLNSFTTVLDYRLSKSAYQFAPIVLVSKLVLDKSKLAPVFDELEAVARIVLSFLL